MIDWNKVRDNMGLNPPTGKSRELLLKSYELLSEYVDDEYCNLDHHGYCQTHLWFDNSECINCRTKKVLDEIRKFLKIDEQ